MTEESKQAALSVFRSLLLTAIAWAAGKGWITEALGTDLLGAIMVIATAAWGAWDKIQSERKTKAREAVAVNVGITVADRTAGPTPLVPAASTQDVIAHVAPAVPTPGATQ